jgi:hypothetical protein
MKTVNCHRKYPITTNFLDTMLEHSIDIQEGETKLDAFRRGLKELDQIAAELRKEANHESSATVYSVPKGATPGAEPIATYQYRPESLPTISRDKERIEIEIDNSEDIESLKFIKQKYPLMPASLIDHYNKRMTDLTTGRPQNFTDGLS